jgi:hypothetical protein
MRQLRGILEIVRLIAGLVRVFAVPLLVAIFASIILALPAQMLEYYRVLLEDLSYGPKFEFARHFVVGLLSLLAMAAVIGATSRALELADRNSWHSSDSADGIDDPGLRETWNFGYHFAPTVIAILPLLATAYGLIQAGRISANINHADIVAEVKVFDKDYADDLNSLLTWAEKAKLYFGFMAATLLVCAIACLVLSYLLYRRDGLGSTALYRIATAPQTLAISAAFVLAIIFQFSAVPVWLPQYIGSIAIFALFVGCLVWLAALIDLWSKRTRIPILTGLFILAIVFSWLDSNDNHNLRRVDSKEKPVELARGSAPPPSGLPSVEEQFVDWYSKRADVRADRYANGKYPVYVVAAQGGGIYATAQTLDFLIKMQSACERFASHLFAISGVSGGSMGAALYSAFARDFPNAEVSCDGKTGEEAEWAKMTPGRKAFFVSDKLLVKDFLSPLVAAALFPDFAQRFLWFKIPSWSRERALEQAFEQGWAQAWVDTWSDPDFADPQALIDSPQGPMPNPMQQGLIGSWSASGARPALLLNTTETDSGRRRLISPFQFNDTGNSDLRTLQVSRDYDVPLSAAAIASARFPWLTPAASIWDARGKGSERIKLVDGAYFDNSGVTTAIDLIQRMEKAAMDHSLPVQINLIVMTSRGIAEGTFDHLSELLAPIRSLLNSTSARNFTTIDLADHELGTVGSSGAAGRIRRLQKVEIDDFVTRLPLGWRLSIASKFQIDRRTGIVEHCAPNDRFEQASPIRAFSSADCTKLLIYHQLRGDNLDDALTAAKKQASRSE